MKNAKFFAMITSISLVAASPFSAAQANNANPDSFPERPVRMLVGYPPGGNVDIAARIIADDLSQRLGQPVIVENRAGASGQIAAAMTTQAEPDGYTIFLGASPELAITHSLKREVSYDARRDFDPISLATHVPFALVVHPSVEAQSVDDLIALAEKAPGELNYASFGAGSSNHLFAELFKAETGADITHIPYKGGGPAITDLLAGLVQIEFESLGVTLPHLQAGKLRALAVAMPERASLAPDIPTMVEVGFGNLLGGTWNGFVGPAGMPSEIVKTLNLNIMETLNEPSVQEKLIHRGVIPSPSTPEEFGEFIATEIERWEEVAEAADIRID